MSLRIIVYGKVQGVWFRASTKDKADKLSLAGTVRNLADGSVEIIVHGPSDRVLQLVDWAREGSQRAQVDQIVSKEITYRELGSFEVIR